MTRAIPDEQTGAWKAEGSARAIQQAAQLRDTVLLTTNRMVAFTWTILGTLFFVTAAEHEFSAYQRLQPGQSAFLTEGIAAGSDWEAREKYLSATRADDTETIGKLLDSGEIVMLFPQTELIMLATETHWRDLHEGLFWRRVRVLSGPWKGRELLAPDGVLEPQVQTEGN
jgi:hypothetical protein